MSSDDSKFKKPKPVKKSKSCKEDESSGGNGPSQNNAKSFTTPPQAVRDSVKRGLEDKDGDNQPTKRIRCSNSRCPGSSIASATPARSNTVKKVVGEKIQAFKMASRTAKMTMARIEVVKENLRALDMQMKKEDEETKKILLIQSSLPKVFQKMKQTARFDQYTLEFLGKSSSIFVDYEEEKLKMLLEIITVRQQTLDYQLDRKERGILKHIKLLEELDSNREQLAKETKILEERFANLKQ